MEVADDVLVERPLPRYGYSAEALIYYLPAHDVCVVENVDLPQTAGQYRYYRHVGQTAYDAALDCWVFADWFVDVLVAADCRRFTVWDLADLAEVCERGVVTAKEPCRILRATAKIVKLIEEGRFPLAEMRLAKEALWEAGLA